MSNFAYFLILASTLSSTMERSGASHSPILLPSHLTNNKIKSGKTLVIVESPSKALTLRKFLPETYIVDSSAGHIRQLIQRRNGFDGEAKRVNAFDLR